MLAPHRLSLFNRPPPYLSPFEYELVFNMPHAGWVEYIGRGRFKLRKSPFLNEYSRYTYLCGEDNLPPENALIEVEGREIKKPVFRKADGRRPVVGTYRYTMEVESWHELDLNSFISDHLPTSAAVEEAFGQMVGIEVDGTLSMREFLYYLSSGWENASADGLDTVLGLQYVSCPEAAYGRGGIGVQVYSIGGSLGQINRYGSYVSGVLPREFTRDHPLYSYMNINRREDAEKMGRRKARELNYTYLKILPPEEMYRPIQIPLLLEGAERKKGPIYLPPEVISYQLTALMIRPVIDENALREFERYILEVEKLRYRADDKTSSIDLSAINRIAEGLVRLRLRRKLDEDRFREAAKTFAQYYEEYLDYRDALAPFRGGTTYDRPTIRTSYLRSVLRREDIDVLRAILKLCDETGTDWVPYDMVTSAVGREDIMPMVMNLQNYGYIIQKQNYGYLKAVILDEERSEVE